MKIDQIILDGFRGATKPFRIIFPDNKSLVLFGNNGDGKSSITDAIEWFFFDEIEHLTKEGCGREDYFNRGQDAQQDAKVSISFDDGLLKSEKILRRRGGSEFTNDSDIFLNFIESIKTERIILRHHTMRNFVDKSKKDKLEDVEDIIGFSEVKKTRNELVKAKNALENNGDLKELRGKLSERELDISTIIGDKKVNDLEIIKYSDGIRASLNWNKPIVDLASMGEMAEEASKELEKLNRDKLLLELSDLDSLNVNVQRLKVTIASYTELINRHNKLISDRRNIESVALEKLYTAATEVIEQNIIEENYCPLCKKEINTEKLLFRLREDVRGLSQVKRVRTELNYEASANKKNLISLLDTIQKLKENDLQKQIFPNNGTTILTIIDLLVEYGSNLDNLGTSSEHIKINEPTQTIWIEVNRFSSGLSAAINERRKEILGDEANSIFYENLSKLKRLTDSYNRYREISKSILIFDQQIYSLQVITEDFEKVENEALSKILKELSGDVNDYFSNFLHPDDNLKEIILSPTDARGIEFQVKFYGNQISPPRKVLSESHLNSLGICLFLASARYFNRKSGFLILDDVISSFDANHRRTFARLLREKFSDKQILLLTHDDMWFNNLKNDLPSAKWIFNQIGKWDYEKGIQIISYTPLCLREEIDWLLSNNSVDTAANKTRVLIEGILKGLCDQLGVTGLEYRVGISNDIRDPSELIDALVNYLKTNNSLRTPSQKQIFNDVKSDQLLTNIGSHHRTLGVTGLKRGDVNLVLKDLDEFENLFICQDCGKSVNKVYTNRNEKIKQCKCGNLKI